ncbi:hypothetical protein N9917_01505 [Deltaproteobacteria bacterium]|nr:hypothetical protein [Deltaproteobacteria bacterium]
MTSPVELARRLTVLESALGIDQESQCVGAGDECPVECHPKRCPLKNNNLRQATAMLENVLEGYTLIQCWAEEMEHAGHVPEGTWARAMVRRDLAEVSERLRQARTLDERLGSVETNPFIEGVRRRITELQAKQTALRVALANGNQT